MKKLLTILLTTLMVLSLTACGKKETTAVESGPVVTETTTPETEIETPTSDEETGLANPWVTCATLAEAEELAGVTFTAPESLEGYEGTTYQVIENTLLEVFYGTEDNRVILRKSVDVDNSIVGDYNEYSVVEDKEIAGMTVTVKGNEAGIVNNALWTNDGHSYSIFAENGIEESLVETLISEAK